MNSQLVMRLAPMAGSSHFRRSSSEGALTAHQCVQVCVAVARNCDVAFVEVFLAGTLLDAVTSWRKPLRLIKLKLDAVRIAQRNRKNQFTFLALPMSATGQTPQVSNRANVFQYCFGQRGFQRIIRDSRESARAEALSELNSRALKPVPRR